MVGLAATASSSLLPSSISFCTRARIATSVSWVAFSAVGARRLTLVRHGSWCWRRPARASFPGGDHAGERAGGGHIEEGILAGAAEGAAGVDHFRSLEVHERVVVRVRIGNMDQLHHLPSKFKVIASA